MPQSSERYLEALTYKEVIYEPVVCDESNVSPALIADLGIQDMWLLGLSDSENNVITIVKQ